MGVGRQALGTVCWFEPQPEDQWVLGSVSEGKRVDVFMIHREYYRFLASL